VDKKAVGPNHPLEPTSFTSRRCQLVPIGDRRRSKALICYFVPMDFVFQFVFK